MTTACALAGTANAGLSSRSQRVGLPPAGPSGALAWNTLLEAPQSEGANVLEVVQGTILAPAPCTEAQPGGSAPAAARSKFSLNSVVNTLVPVGRVMSSSAGPCALRTDRCNSMGVPGANDEATCRTNSLLFTPLSPGSRFP